MLSSLPKHFVSRTAGRKNLRAMLASATSKLDLVTREEFEVQAQLLLRTREKLDALEARVSALEARRSRSPARKQI